MSHSTDRASPALAVGGAAVLALAGLVVGFLFSIVTISLIDPVVSLPPDSPERSAVALAAQGAGLVAVVFLYLERYELPWSYLRISRPSLREAGLAVLATVVLFVALAIATVVIEQLGLVEQSIVTGLLIGLFATGVWLAKRARRWFGDEDRLERVDAGIAFFVVASGLAITYAILAIWSNDLAQIDALSNFAGGNPAEVATRAAFSVLLLVGIYVFTDVVKDFVYDLTEDTTALTRHQTELLFRSTQVSLYILVFLVILGIWEVNIGGLLVGAGVLGIVIGLAAQQTLGSLLAGFVLMFARPFEIGDWVQIGDREGIVTEISIVNTRIQTFDGEYAMIPNDMVESNEIINRTRKGRLRIRVEVGVDYGTDLDVARDAATEAMREVDDVLAVPQPQVVLKEFSNSAITLGLRFWIDKPSSRRRWRAQTAVVQSVKQAFDREGIKIPFPQRELMGRVEEGGFRLAPQEVETPTTMPRSDGQGAIEGDEHPDDSDDIAPPTDDVRDGERTTGDQGE